MRNKWMIAAWIIGAVVAGIGHAWPQIVPALPFQLQNNTVADATQVMANFNQLLNNINANAAKNGSNSDITALLGLTTPLAPGVGGTTVFTGGTSGGSANAQTVATVVPSTFSLVLGSRVIFVSNFTNTAAVTLNVASSGAKAVWRQTSLGPRSTAGGELGAGAIVEVVYDGVQYQIVGTPVLVGDVRDYGAGAPPTGYLLADGSCVSQTTYAALFEVFGTQWGSCSAGNFALVDANQRVIAGQGNGNNRLSSAGCSGALTSTCGLSGGIQTFAQGNLPNVVWPTTLSISDTQAWTVSGQGAGTIIDGAGSKYGGGGSGNAVTLGVSRTGSVALTGGTSSGGSSTPFSITQPTITLAKIIKY